MSRLHLAFIVDPIHALNPAKDSSIAMMRAAQQFGHRISVIEAGTLRYSKDPSTGKSTVVGNAMEIIALGPKQRNQDWFMSCNKQVASLTRYDAILMRKDPPFDFNYITALWLLRTVELSGTPVFNQTTAIRDTSEKLSILEFPEFTPNTIVSNDPLEIHEFINCNSDVIIKPLDGMGGRGVFRLTIRDPNRYSIIETMFDRGNTYLMCQTHIPEISAGDKRILLIGGEIFPYSLARIPREGETRGNLAAGGTGIAQPLSKRDREIADYLAPRLNKRGLSLVGIDVIGDYLTEINVTSPTCMVELYAQTGQDPAAQYIQHIQKSLFPFEIDKF